MAEIADLIEEPDFTKLRAMDKKKMYEALDIVFKTPNSGVLHYEMHHGYWIKQDGVLFKHAQWESQSAVGLCTTRIVKDADNVFNRMYDLQDGVEVQLLKRSEQDTSQQPIIRGMLVETKDHTDLYIRRI